MKKGNYYIRNMIEVQKPVTWQVTNILNKILSYFLKVYFFEKMKLCTIINASKCKAYLQKPKPIFRARILMTHQIFMPSYKQENESPLK